MIPIVASAREKGMAQKVKAAEVFSKV